MAAMLNEASCQPKTLTFILKTQTYKFSYGPDTKKESNCFIFFFFKLDGTLGGHGCGTLHIEGLQATNWFFFTLIFFLCVCVLSACVSKHHMCTCPQRSDDLMGYPGTAVTGCEPACACWKPNVNPLKKRGATSRFLFISLAPPARLTPCFRGDFTALQ